MSSVAENPPPDASRESEAVAASDARLSTGSGSAGGNDRLGYRHLADASLPGWRGARAIWRWNLKLILRRKLFWVILALGLFHFMMHFAMIYMKAQLSEDIKLKWLARLLEEYRVTEDGRAYQAFLTIQTRAVIILLAYAGVVLITSDYRAGGITFYLSKPINKLQYLVGKVGALLTIVGMVTLLPALMLFFEYGVYGEEGIRYWFNNPRVFLGILAYGLLIMIVPSILLLAVGSVFRRSAPFLMIWLAIFLVLPAVGELFRSIFDARDFRLMNLWHLLRLLGEMAFGFPLEGYTPNTRYRWFDPAISAFILVPIVCYFAARILLRRLQAVEVIQ